ncbi:MAG: amidohydrolase [Chloroflexota bacterium]|nr:amidohydrolase [Chloroflexota bacterium]
MDADLLLVGGRVFRGFGPGETPPDGSEAGAPSPQAPTAAAIVDDRIEWVGRDRDALADWRGPRTEVLDAHGGLILAGFEDAHIHLLEGARGMDEVDLFGAADVPAILELIRAHAAAHPEDGWVTGHGWMYVPFPGGLPTREQLDAAVPNRPAWMTCYDGHTGWVNSAGLAVAGIDRNTPDPPDGIIVRDPTTREPTGALKEGAVDLVARMLPRPTPDDDLAALRRTIADLHAAGITAVQEAWAGADEVELWRRLLAAGELPLRVRLALQMTPDMTVEQWGRRLDEYEALAFPLRGGLWLSAGILKAFADGVIESRTAAMLAPYVDDTSTGLPNWAPDQLDAFVRSADDRGWQLEIHAIGDRGVRMTLDAFERAAYASGARARRHRLEHVETIDAADIPRFGRQGVIASMQPYHADPSPNQISLWAGNIGPERATRAWPWASILRQGGRVAFGSDWPVVPFDPFIALNAAVNRQTVDGTPPGGWLPSERLTLPEALSAYTLGSAHAAWADGRRGTVAPGLDPDLVVLDRDLLSAGASAIIGTNIRLTVVGGRIVHRTEDVS